MTTNAAPMTLTPVARRWLAAAFPTGYAPEEGRPLDAWPWDEEHRAVPPPLRRGDAVAELHRIETLAAQGRDAGEVLSAWVAANLSPEGLFLPAPSQTYIILPALVRMNRLLELPPLAATIVQALGGVFRGPPPAEWTAPEHRGPSAVYKAMLAKLLAEPVCRQWRGVAAALWNIGPAARIDAKLELGFVSESAGVAVLRRDWSPAAALCSLDFREAVCRLQFRLGGRYLLSSYWETEIRRNDQPAPIRGKWGVVCWYADSDGEYLELAMPLARGLALERQLFVARKIPLVLFCDSLRSPTVAELQIEWKLHPRADVVTGLQGDLKTRAQRLAGASPSIAAAPLFLAADPLIEAAGRMAPTADGRILVSHHGTGKCLQMPVAWLWEENAPLALAPWRNLSITNDGEPATAGDALAVRLPVGLRQFIFFRSMIARRRLAFLGHQTFDECILGEFNPKGDVVPWLRIE